MRGQYNFFYGWPCIAHNKILGFGIYELICMVFSEGSSIVCGHFGHLIAIC